MGLTIGPGGALWFVDGGVDEVVRVGISNRESRPEAT